MGTKPLIIAARYKLLLILPFVVIVPIAIIIALATRSSSYYSSATVWVQPSVFLDTAGITQDNPYLSPAQNQAGVLNELMQTDSFAAGVARRAGLGGGGGSDGDLAQQAREGTTVSANGNHLVIIANRSGEAARAQAIVGGVVDEFSDFYSQNVLQAAEQAALFYERQVNDQRGTLEDARSDLNAYLRSNPSPGLNDSRFIELQANVDRAQDDIDRTQRNLTQVASITDATISDRDESFRVVDAASLPTAPIKEGLRSLAILPIAALLLALSLSAGTYGFLLRTDNSIRIAEDLQALPGLKLLGTVPDVSHVRRPRWPRHFFRLAITALGVNAQR